MIEIAEIPAFGRACGWGPYFVSSDAHETRSIVGSQICAHRLEHRSPKNRPVTVRFRSSELGALSLHEMAYTMFDGDARIFVPDMADIYLCEINLGGDMRVGQRVADMPFVTGHVYMVNANRPHTKWWGSDGRQMMIKIHRRDVEAAVERVTGLPVHEPLLFSGPPQPVAGRPATLAHLVEVVASDLDQASPCFGGGRATVDGANHLLIDLILQTFPNNYSALLSNPPPQVRPRHVRRAAEFIHTYFAEPITSSELAAASGVSPRALHAGFVKNCGVPPMTYLRNVRLDRARLRLRRGAAAGETVTEAALACGFTHLSKFARAYRERFGELPSETLRQG